MKQKGGGSVVGRTLKVASVRGALAPWRYEATLNRWIGGKARAFRAFTADMVGVGAGEAVLDLGCGTGELALALARRVGPDGRVAGIDLSRGLIEGARRRAKRAGLSVDYRVGTIERLPFAAASMDVVVSSLVMHHLAPDVLARAVAEIRRVLKPGGRVFVIDFQSLDQAGKGHGHSHGHGHGHAHRPALHDHGQGLVELLKAAGLGDAGASLIEFGQRLEVTRGRLGVQ